VIRPNCAFAGSLLCRARELFADARLLDLATTRPLIGEIAVLSFVSGKVQS
jgi:hypothetical protein